METVHCFCSRPFPFVFAPTSSVAAPAVLRHLGVIDARLNFPIVTSNVNIVQVDIYSLGAGVGGGGGC